MLEAAAWFGGAVAPEIADLLQRAVSRPDTAEPCLQQALALDPQALPVYYGLYKCHFRRGQLAEAEYYACCGLLAAAVAAGLPADRNLITRQSADWYDVNGPAHFYLFTLKALAFIRLRRGDRADASSLLQCLARLDPNDSVGWSVIAQMAEQAVA